MTGSVFLVIDADWLDPGGSLVPCKGSIVRAATVVTALWTELDTRREPAELTGVARSALVARATWLKSCTRRYSVIKLVDLPRFPHPGC
jgi:hypothetical protein